MNAQQLKNSILQMAIQGKLIPQDPTDEPASILLERIHTEKKKLIKAGKIKRNKHESVICKKGNSYYETIDGVERCIDEEVPFDIPESWMWVRFSSVMSLKSGQDMSPDKYNDNFKGIPYITGASNIEDGEIIINRWTEYGKSFAHKGDILLTCKGTVGTLAILDEPKVHIARQIMAITPSGELNRRYILLVLDSFVSKLKHAAKSMIPGISREDVLAAFVPIPPIQEQHCIVGKVEELLPLIEKYGDSEELLDKIHSNFPDQLKKSILQLAVQGRLVPQYPTDEPASALLERIRDEKEQLIKDGKIKRDKHESVICRKGNSYYETVDGVERCIDEEVPFEIPDNWEWVRLRQIVFNHGQKKPTSDFCYIDIGSIDNKNQLLNENETILNPSKAPSRARKIIKRNDIIYSTVRPYLHNMCIISKDFSREAIASTGFAVLATHAELFNKFLFYCMLSPNFDSYANNTDNAKGVAYPAINDEKLYNALIPLPPVEEQHRIVVKIEELMAACNKI